MDLEIAVNTNPETIDILPYHISGQCTDLSTVVLTSNTSALFSSIQYDRTKTPLNDWSCQISNMTVGNNTITITCSL